MKNYVGGLVIISGMSWMKMKLNFEGDWSDHSVAIQTLHVPQP